MTQAPPARVLPATPWPPPADSAIAAELRGDEPTTAGDPTRVAGARRLPSVTFAEAAEHSTPAELIDWLREHGYSHVYVDWGEMSRLRRSRYGFWKSIDVALFEKLQEHGLRAVQNFSIDENRSPYATLYEVTTPARR